MTSNEKMGLPRAHEIALALMEYTASRKEFILNPQDKKPGSGHEYSARVGIPLSELRAFTFLVTAPAAIQAGEGDDIEITFKGEKPSEQRLGEIALAMVKDRAMRVSPNDFLERIRSAHKYTGIPESEIRHFYAMFVTPHIAAIVGKFTRVSLTTETAPTTQN
jgi:hypothetical protein